MGDRERVFVCCGREHHDVTPVSRDRFRHIVVRERVPDLTVPRPATKVRVAIDDAARRRDPLELRSIGDMAGEPAVRFEMPAVTPTLSPSGDFLAAMYVPELEPSSIILFELGENEVRRERRFASSSPFEAYPTDSGHVVVSTEDGVWTASFEDEPRDLVGGHDEDEVSHRFSISQEDDLVVIAELSDGTATGYSVHDLRDGSSRPFDVADACELSRSVGAHAYFICERTRFERIELRAPNLELRPVEGVPSRDQHDR